MFRTEYFKVVVFCVFQLRYVDAGRYGVPLHAEECLRMNVPKFMGATLPVWRLKSV